MRREYTAEIQLTTTVMRISTENSSMKGVSHSGFRPVSSRSRKVRAKAGLIMPIREEMVVVRITKATATPDPFSRSLA